MASHYEQLRTLIKSAPKAWAPGLLEAAVSAAVEKKIFKPGDLIRNVEQIERETNERLKHHEQQSENIDPARFAAHQ